MSGDLFGSLSLAARALEAQRSGLDVVGQNIANVNTAGYSRRVVDISTIAPENAGGAERGADVVAIRALRDRLLDRRLLQDLPSEAREAAMAGSLSLVQSALGQSGSSLDANLEAFFNAFANLAEDPASAVSRHEVQFQGDALASAFRSIAGRFEAERRDADRQIGGAVESVNRLAARIALQNRTLSTSPPETALGVRDEQGLLIRQLSELIDLQVLEHEDGSIDVSMAGGRALVVGGNVYELSADPRPVDGYLELSANGAVVTGQIAGGRLGGLLAVRDVNIPDYQSRLDVLAYETAQQVNALHAAGYDLDGAAGGDFFSFSPAVVTSAGAAAAIVLDATVAGDPRTIAAAGVTEAGDNQNARAIAALRDARVLDGGTATLSEGWGQLVYGIGSDTMFAEDEQRSRQEVVRQIDALRDEVSGVSLDEEAMHLLKFQRAYEAIAHFFRTIDRSIDTLMAMAG
jgi:flagellar hook-associated protein 1 FlgK